MKLFLETLHVTMFATVKKKFSVSAFIAEVRISLLQLHFHSPAIVSRRFTRTPRFQAYHLIVAGGEIAIVSN